jgi:hypothetical protein
MKSSLHILIPSCHFSSIIFDCHLKRLPQLSQLAWDLRYIASGQIQQRTPFPSLYLNYTSIVIYIFVSAGTCLPSYSIAVNIYSGFTIPAFRQHVTIDCDVTHDSQNNGARNNHLLCGNGQ